jgi:streptomycin 6-kinase
MINLPQTFIENTLGVYGQQGKEWLEHLEELIMYCQERWSIKVLSPYSLSYNYVAPVEGREAVLKLVVPGKEFQTEKAALLSFAGKGVCKLLQSDEEKGILLLERVMPGYSLKKITSDDQATLIAARVIERMQSSAHTNIDPVFPTIAQWAAGLKKLRQHFKETTGPIPEAMVAKAERFYPKLCASIKNPRLLHGDFHQDNILKAEREDWLAIDPKGLIGETEYEVIPFLMNNLPQEDAFETIEQRVTIFVKTLHLNKNRVLAWAFCHAILSAWWCIEDKTDCMEVDIETAEIFERLLSVS